MFTHRALEVLGLSNYTKYLFHFIVSAFKILNSGDFRPLDLEMGSIAKIFRYRGRKFIFDCEFCDSHLEEDSYGFGIVREIYIRDCYFKWHAPLAYENAKVVVDLGANRGAFSTLMTTKADFILSVECGQQYTPIIKHNLSMNRFKAFAIENVFVGSGGATLSDSTHISMDDLLERHSIHKVDFLKMDIEGSEFSLFENADWLARVNALSMEVHVEEGDPATILESLGASGFSYRVADENLVLTDDLSLAGFIYAWRD